MASRACSGDMSDIHLQSTISAARAVQLPKERMERAIERGANPAMKNEGEDYILRRYDGMIPTGGSGGKVAVIIEALTENRNRTAANVRNFVTTRCGGELMPTGANDWLFEHTGVIMVSKYMKSTDGSDNVDESDAASDPNNNTKVEIDVDALLECALEGGATDVEFSSEDSEDSEGDDEDNDTNNHARIKCEPIDMLHLVQTLTENGYVTTEFENQWLLKDEGNKIVLDERESIEKFERFLGLMDEDMDVTNVFHNASFADDAI